MKFVVLLRAFFGCFAVDHNGACCRKSMGIGITCINVFVVGVTKEYGIRCCITLQKIQIWNILWWIQQFCDRMPALLVLKKDGESVKTSQKNQGLGRSCGGFSTKIRCAALRVTPCATRLEIHCVSLLRAERCMTARNSLN